MAGKSVTFNGTLDYGMLAGQKVNVNGTINNDVLIAGDTITFADDFKSERDVFVFGKLVNISGDIDRNMVIYADKVVIDKADIDNLKIKASVIEINDDVTIDEFDYNEDASIKIGDKASITTTNLSAKLHKNYTLTEQLLSNAMSYAMIMVVFVALALIVPGMFKRIEKKQELTTFNFVSMMGYGALSLIIFPLLGSLLFLSVIGIPLAIILFAFYIAVFMLSIIFTGYYLGLVIYKKLLKKDVNILLSGLMGITILYLLSIIPKIGFIVALVYALAGMGVVIKLFAKDN